MVRCPPLVLSFTQAHLCDAPFSNLSRDNCARPHENKRWDRYKHRAIWKASLSAGHSRVPKSEGYLNRSFLGVKKGGIKGEVKREEVVGEWTGPGLCLEGKDGGKMRDKEWEKRGPEKRSKNSDFGTPPLSSFPCLFGFPCFFDVQGIPCFFERFSLLTQGF